MKKMIVLFSLILVVLSGVGYAKESVLIADFDDPAVLESWSFTKPNSTGTVSIVEEAAAPTTNTGSGLLVEITRNDFALSFAGNLHYYFPTLQDWRDYSEVVFYVKGFVPAEGINYPARCILLVRQESGVIYEGGDWNNVIVEKELGDGWFEVSFPLGKMRPQGGALGALHLDQITGITISISMPASYPYESLSVYIDEVFLR